MLDLNIKDKYIWFALRISMGWIFLWAFIDKLFGLGFSTQKADAWIAGGSPTAKFLEFAPKGPFGDLFRSMAGVGLVDWLFMLGLLGVGVSLIFGVFVRFGSYVGILMMFLIYLAISLPPENNPIIDEHIIYILILLGIANSPSILSLDKLIKKR